MFNFKQVTTFASALFMFQICFAQTYEVPMEELAQETVLPVFENREMVKSRSVVTEKKLEFGPYVGANTTEPILNQLKYGFNIGYHPSEQSAWMLNYASWASGLNSTYTDSLSQPDNYLDFSRSPKKKYSAFLNYERKMFYGKMSLTKRSVVNMHLYPIFGGGITAYEHKNYYGVDAGIGQKFYFSPAVALRLDVKLQYAQYPSPFLKGKMRSGNPGGSDPVPGLAEFKDKWGLDTNIELGFSFIF